WTANRLGLAGSLLVPDDRRRNAARPGREWSNRRRLGCPAARRRPTAPRSRANASDFTRSSADRTGGSYPNSSRLIAFPPIADVGRPFLIFGAVGKADGPEAAGLIKAPCASVGLEAP